MIPLNIPWKLVGAVALFAMFALAGWRVSAWHSAYKELQGVQARLKNEEACGEGSKCQARQAKLQAAQDEKAKEVVDGYEKELADLRSRPPVTRVIRVCKADPGNVRDAAGSQGTDGSSPGTGVVQSADEFNTQPLRDLAREADEVSARLRALQGWAGAK